ncbi:uncharacterized protein GIQ15_04327 [Arthroderma uncinatum]|uniref:uncharacterized protein n=1 Tax=Arthroderma uncinatum TaxID=74035 RepID=UPI00144AAF5D|nr:uncharacterized protein GIQ15_04327 [Arthroderma uncinatum]KAF3481568.1 hypothetical protein GIQ15_04327 [Arthroderma uncinatum]
MSDQRLFLEKASHYVGRAKIDLRHFRFERNLSEVRTISDKQVENLVNGFRHHGCYRLKPDNYVQALISSDVLQHALATQRLERQDLLGDAEPRDLELPADAFVEVLHGRHRLLAAERFLWDKWWIADLYVDNLPPWVEAVMREEHSNAHQFCDGDIYRNLRYYQSRESENEEEKWRARLSSGKRDDLDRMDLKARRLRRAFDRLLPFKGLWSALKLGYLGRLLRLRSSEELVHYLDRIHRIYTHILGGYQPGLLDPKTVSKIETLTPSFSSHDAARARQMMSRRQIFPAVQSQDHRDRILDRILSVRGRILSFHTFFQDFLYFEACALVLRGLLPTPLEGAMREMFSRSYTGVNQAPGNCRIQVGETEFLSRPGTREASVRLGYRQLFLAVMLLDFETERTREIRALVGRDPEKGVARNLLGHLRPAERYDVDEERTDELATTTRQAAFGIGDKPDPLGRMHRVDPTNHAGGAHEILDGASSALGSEGFLGQGMNEFYPIQGDQAPSAVIKQFRLAREVVVIFIPKLRLYAKFSSNPEQQDVFKSSAQSLVNKDYRFTVIKDDDRVVVQKLRGLWEAALDCKLVVACPKSNPSSLDTGNVIGTAEDFYRFIDSQH